MARYFFVRLTRIIGVALAVTLVLGSSARSASAQSAPRTSAEQELRTRIERQFEVLPLRDGLLLKSKGAAPNRSVELSNGRIAINGTDVTGAELRQQLGSDADVVVQLSYLDAPTQHTLFGFSSQAGAATAAPAPVTPPLEPRTRKGGQVRFGGDVTVGPNEVLDDDVVVFGGTARVEGEVDGDVVAIGGRVELGPNARVTQDVTVIGGSLQRAPGAVIGGKVTELGAGSTGFGTSGGRVRSRDFRAWPFSGMMPFVRAMATTLRIAALMLLACVILLVARQPIERIGARAAAEPLKAGLVGLLLELLFIPTLIVTVVLLVVTIIGIPLLALVPFALLAAVIVLLMGFTAIAYLVGERAAARFGWATSSPYLATVAGVVIVFVPLLLARILGVALGGLAFVTIPFAIVGGLIEYSAWTVGLGAAALDRFRPMSMPTPTSSMTAPAPPV